MVSDTHSVRKVQIIVQYSSCARPPVRYVLDHLVGAPDAVHLPRAPSLQELRRLPHHGVDPFGHGGGARFLVAVLELVCHRAGAAQLEVQAHGPVIAVMGHHLPKPESNANPWRFGPRQRQVCSLPLLVATRSISGVVGHAVGARWRIPGGQHHLHDHLRIFLRQVARHGKQQGPCVLPHLHGHLPRTKPVEHVGYGHDGLVGQ